MKKEVLKRLNEQHEEVIQTVAADKQRKVRTP